MNHIVKPIVSAIALPFEAAMSGYQAEQPWWEIMDYAQNPERKEAYERGLEQGTNQVISSIMPSRIYGTFNQGMTPWNPENRGFNLSNNDETNENLNLLGDLIAAKVAKPRLLTRPFTAETRIPKPMLFRHLLGDDALKMFLEYGGLKLPETGYLDLMRYVPEARIKYGLVGDTRISDLLIAEALYKQAKEISGTENPLLLFRGDTKAYTTLLDRSSPIEAAQYSGTMDNSLGTLFLGELPDGHIGVNRYIGTVEQHPIFGLPDTHGILKASGTGSTITTPLGVKVIESLPTSYGEAFPIQKLIEDGGYSLGGDKALFSSYKLPAFYMDTKVNDLNLFIPRKPVVRDATKEISVLNDEVLGSKYSFNGGDRSLVAKFYTNLLQDSENKGLTILKSDAAEKIPGKLRANHPLRDEHDTYTYYAVPNYAKYKIKHILPYDMRIPRNWEDPNIFRLSIPSILSFKQLYKQDDEK